MQNLRNVIVTGCNKGIGYGIVENLAQKQGWNIIMACRSVDRANEARTELLSRFPNAQLHVEQLDVADPASVDSFVKVVGDKYKAVDVLINNAGVAAKGDAFDEHIVRYNLETNFYGTIDLTEKLLKHIKDCGKLIFNSSVSGKMTNITNEKIKQKFRDSNLAKEDIFALMNDFLDTAKEGTSEKRGWPKQAHAISKLGINYYAQVLTKYIEVKQRNIQVYALCPGFVDTDMTEHKGTLTIQEGAEASVYFLQLPFKVIPEWQGKFFERCSLSSLE